jgi:RNA polymerase sigma-70 factor (ECF subfamily)
MVDYEDAVHAHYENLFRFARRLSGNDADAADLTQDTFHRLALNLGKIRDRGKIRSWLFSTLYRRFIDGRRHNRRFPKVEFDETWSETLSSSAPSTRRAVDQNLVVAAVDQLEPDLRAPLLLFYMRDFTYREIADTLEVPLGTVMSRLHRAKSALHAALTAPPKSTLDTAL